ncbi:MAG: SusC/RagA family TonB-linked outer membrane protein [Paludibacteraceae bacterium]|nr:SusC/RagA family TonB-linked outer membrane protein [Paludibacteraceae bacterium]
MKNKLSIVMTMVMLTFASAMFAQVNVTGTVLDASNGDPIIGANIIVMGTTVGTVTDFDGKFSLSVQEDATLQISYMGYKAVELPAQTVMNVRLHEDTEVLDEVMVVGYGTVKKNDATGSVTAIKPDDMNKGLQVTAQDMIAGKIAGVAVTLGDGTPGGGAQIRIRGGSSLSASNDPLIVIDGLAMDNDGIKGVANGLSLVNPNDIETFTVLKDASATAIYGSRASNGVIIITTKKGSADQKLKVTYSGNVSVGTLTKTMDVFTGDQLRTYAQQLGLSNSKLKKLGTTNTDWQTQIYRPAISTDHNISLMGGVKGKKVSMPYRASIGYTLQNGIIKTSQMQRVTASINLSPSFLDKHLNFNLNAKGMYSYNRYAPGVVGAAIAYDPTCPVKADNMDLFGGFFGRTQSGSTLNDPQWSYMYNGQAPANPVNTLEMTNDRANSGAFIGNLEADYKIHGLEDLSIHANFGADYSYGKQVTSISPHIQTANFYYGYEGWSEQKKYNLSFNAYAQYYKDFSETQHFDIMAGGEYQKFHRIDHSQGGGVLQSTNNKYDALNPINNRYNYTENDFGTQSALLSFFGRVNWVGWNQIMLTATVRGDASTRFSPKNRWGVFPSVALGWKIKETFFKDNNKLSEWKLRLGYGITGQQNLNQGDFQWLPIYKIDVPGTGAMSTIGVIDPATGEYIYNRTYRPNEYNPDLTWEKTTTYNIGMDWGFLNNRITMNADYYYRVTNDLINVVDIPAGTNFKTRVIKNIGSLYNMGVEYSINAVAIDRKNFKWDLGFNASWNKNQITKLTASDDPKYYVYNSASGIGNDQMVQANAVGHPMNSFYLYDVKKNPATGTLCLIDQDHPNAFPGDPDYDVTPEDKIFYHSPAADFLFGFTTKFQFYGFDLGISLRASVGNYVYNSVLQDQGQYILAIYDAKFEGYHSVLRNAYNAYWRDGNRLRVDGTTDGILSTAFVEDASFLRCDNITLGYTFQPKKSSINGRVYATVSNPFVISGYSGLDPEIVGGIDNNMYPRSMSSVIGVTLNF